MQRREIHVKELSNATLHGGWRFAPASGVLRDATRRAIVRPYTPPGGVTLNKTAPLAGGRSTSCTKRCSVTSLC